jgi:hypothetical protein
MPGRPFDSGIDDWSSGHYLVCGMRFEGVHNARLTVSFFGENDEEPRLGVSYTFLPGLDLWLCFPLKYLDGQTLFLPRRPGQLKATCQGRRLGRDKIARVTLELVDSGQRQHCAITIPHLRNEPPAEPLSVTPMIDTLGQLATRTWLGKTESIEQMRAGLHGELARAESSPPATWSRYGGWRGRRFAASGFFRTEHDGTRWWLVDPEGNAFFSAGVDCVRHPGGTAVVPGTESLFPAGLLDDPLVRAQFYTPEAKWNTPHVELGTYTLYRALGERWDATWRTLTRRRLARWRFNTVACWSDPRFASEANIPYVSFLTGYPSTPHTLFRDLPDVYDPAFTSASQIYARQAAVAANDPFLLGYFMCNEPQWGFGTFNLASEILEARPGSHTRKALASFVAQRYDGDAERWGRAWGVEARDFAVLVDGVHHRMAERGATAARDLWDFSKHIVRRFARIPAEALRAHDPHHLNLGVRFAWIASELLYEVSEYVDVFSMNCYGMLPDTAAAEEIDRRCGRPVVIGEFHFGALDRGLPGNGLRGVADQHERGTAYRAYVDACAAHPSIVGCHWFMYHDQPALGRYDGENWQIGLVDCCGRPYEELCAAATATHEAMYRVRSGEQPPFGARAREVPRIAC